jgi:hypothetical protein
MTPFDEELSQFNDFGKLFRLSREMMITEKIDGTNGQIVVFESGEIRAGSRNKWITPTDDNTGFAKWVEANKEELLKLGPGRHFGEWWGGGIQRGYGLQKGEKKFSLFNVSRWQAERPACCEVVPTLYTGMFDTDKILQVMGKLQETGSWAAPGFMRPEGVVIYHKPSQFMFKKTFEKDEAGKGQ